MAEKEWLLRPLRTAGVAIIMAEGSIINESAKIPATSARSEFLLNCWLEILCTAEIRVLGWLYQESYGRPFHPNNF